MTFRVLIADSLAPEAKAIFQECAGIDVDDRAGISPEELATCIGDYNALVVRSRTQVDESLLDVATRLQVVGRAGIGVDNVDIRAATRAGVVVMNTPDGNAVTTAEHTIAMILSMSRRVPQATASLKGGNWEKKKFVGRELTGKTLGVIGFGNIGRIVANRAVGLKLQVVAFDPYFDSDTALSMGVELVPLEELVRRSHIITVHTPLTDETRGLISDDEIEIMRPGVMLVNCARGGIYDEEALLRGLEGGKIQSVALDVFTEEPPDGSNPLLSDNRVVCTPHLGASTTEAQIAVAVAIAEQVCDFASGEPARNALNLPRINAAELRQMAPYLDLAERLGSFAWQVSEGKVERIAVKLSGDLANQAADPICAAALTGILRHVLDAPVNTVNARLLAEERGIEVITSQTTQPSRGYDNTLEVTLTTGTPVRVGGALFAGGEGRIIEVNGVQLEVVADGHMLLISNQDHPGVIGRIGTTLGKAGINISRMQLGLDPQTELALAVINTDQHVAGDVLASLQSDEILSVVCVSL